MSTNRVLYASLFSENSPVIFWFDHHARNRLFSIVKQIILHTFVQEESYLIISDPNFVTAIAPLFSRICRFESQAAQPVQWNEFLFGQHYMRLSP